MEAFDVLPLTAEEFRSALNGGIGIITAKISFNWKTEELEAYNNLILKEFSNYLNKNKGINKYFLLYHTSTSYYFPIILLIWKFPTAWKTLTKVNRINNVEFHCLNWSQTTNLQIDCKNGEKEL